MHVKYTDIIERAGEPDWYGPHGEPRYGKFRPDMLSVYWRVAVFFEIECQYCEKRFKVADFQTETDVWGILRFDGPYKKAKKLTPEALHYGDPPNHGCVGDTMNCYEIEAIEWWERGPQLNRPRRQRRFEGPLDTDHTLPAVLDKLNQSKLTLEVEVAGPEPKPVFRGQSR
jgi:hypothetical protein